MNKILLIGLLLVAMLGASIAGGVISSTTVKDITIEYPTTKIGDTLTKGDMDMFDGLKYEVKGNTIVLNKEGVFQNRIITINENQDCLTKDKNGECLTWTKYDRNTLIEKTIKADIEFVQGVQVKRANKIVEVADVNGKIIIGEKK